MEKIPKQAVDSDSVWKEIPGTDIGYGPRMERRNHVPDTDFSEESVPDSVEQTSEREWLSPAQRKQLHILLLSLGISVMPPKEGGMAAVGLDSATASGARTVEMLTEQGQTAPSLVAEQLEHEMEREAEKLDDFTAEVEKFKAQLDEADIAQTIKLANTPVRDHPEYTRMSYPLAAVTFRSEADEKRRRPALPSVLREELKMVLPGWIAQESRYKADAVSESRATGIWQIKPWVYKGYRNTDKVSLRMADQTKVAEEIISDNYHYILHYAGDEALAVLRDKFDSEEAFLKELMSPLMINAYNAGGPAIGRMLKKFVSQFPKEEMLSGRDLFLQFADFAKADGTNYSNEAREYVPRIHAFNDILNSSLLVEKGDS